MAICYRPGAFYFFTWMTAEPLIRLPTSVQCPPLFHPHMQSLAVFGSSRPLSSSCTVIAEAGLWSYCFSAEYPSVSHLWAQKRIWIPRNLLRRDFNYFSFAISLHFSAFFPVKYVRLLCRFWNLTHFYVFLPLHLLFCVWNTFSPLSFNNPLDY